MKDAQKIDVIEQYGKYSNLEIAGVRIKTNEDTIKLLLEVAKLLQIEIAPEHIFSLKPNCNGEKNSPSPPIIARFVNRDIRNCIFENRKLTRNLDKNSFSVEDT